MSIVDLKGKRMGRASEVWQYDYGQKLHICGIELQSDTEVQFSQFKTGGETESRVGSYIDGAINVQIPNELLFLEWQKNDYEIYAFIYVSDEKEGRTEYRITIPVKSRPKPGLVGTDAPVDNLFFKIYSDVKQYASEASDYASASLRSAELVANSEIQSEEYKRLAAESADSASRSASSAELYALQSKNSAATASECSEIASEYAEQAEQSKQDSAQSALLAGQSATSSAMSAAESEESATQARNSSDNASSSASDAEKSATEAAKSADNASIFATEANQAASDAKKSASEAAQSSSDAESYKNSSSKSANEAGNYALSASQSATQAGNSADSANNFAKHAENSASLSQQYSELAKQSEINAAMSATNAENIAKSITPDLTEVKKRVSDLEIDLSNKVGYAEISGTTITLYADGTKKNVINSIEIPSSDDKNTTYSFGISGNTITITPSDGVPETIELPSVTDEHIIGLINEKLGVIENGAY